VGQLDRARVFKINLIGKEKLMKTASKIMVCGLALCLWAGTAHAAKMEYDTGNGLLSICSSENLTTNISCTSYILGFFKGAALQKSFTETILKVVEPEILNLDPGLFELFCIPKRVQNNQIRLIITNYLLHNPNYLDESSDTLIIKALREAFPCK